MAITPDRKPHVPLSRNAPVRWHRAAWLTALCLAVPALLFALLRWPPGNDVAAAQVPPGTQLNELIPGFDYVSWFSAETGYTPNAVYLGAYGLVTQGDTLLAGFGNSTPAARNGAILAAYTLTDSLQVVDPLARTIPHSGDPFDNGALNEQGFIGLELADGVVYIPGTDPCCGDWLSDEGLAGPYNHQWDWGNAYVYDIDADTFVKRRNLTNTAHTWGMWYDSGSGVLYAATSGTMGDQPPADNINETTTGRVFSSVDQGDNWTMLADYTGSVVPGLEGAGDGVGTFRTYDIIGFAGKLYIQWSDALPAPPGLYPNVCGLAESSDNGATWTRLTSPDVRCARRLALIDNRLVALNAGDDGVVMIDAAGSLTEIPFPGFTVAERAYTFIAQDGGGNLYVLTADGRVMRSADWSSWETLVSTDLNLLAITYWPAADAMVLSDSGSAGRLWQLPVTATAITLPDTPHLTIVNTGGEAELGWDHVAGATEYRVYKRDAPYFPTFQYNLLSATALTSTVDSDSGVGDDAYNTFYQARAVDNTAVSPNSNTVGEFDFRLLPGD